MGTDWTGLAASAIAVAGFFALLIVVVSQFAAVVRARSAVAQDNAYRRLAEEVAETQQAVVAELAEVKQRLAAIDKLLRDVG
jgi:hypothetical protein